MPTVAVSLNAHCVLCLIADEAVPANMVCGINS